MLSGTRVHLIGIGGEGMSALAELLLAQGLSVSGSDIRPEALEGLRDSGAEVFGGHRPENVADAEVVVYSSAIPPWNPELSEARRRGIPVLPRLIALRDLLQGKRLIAVCGTHGKTTTATWTSYLLSPLGAGRYLGARVQGWDRAQWGSSSWFVAEVDESDGLFRHLEPEIVVITNVDADHLDTYGDFQCLKRSFLELALRARRVVLCYDDPGARDLLGKLSREKAITYGLGPEADVRAVAITPAGRETGFQVLLRGRTVGWAEIPAFGDHNVANALAALTVGYILGLPFQEMLARAKGFPLPKRRLEIVEENGYLVVDDYAHHPREIQAGIRGLRRGWPGRRILALFQPHRFSRTARLAQELGEALSWADLAVVTGIYGAFEERLPGISGEEVAAAARSAGGRALYIPDKNTALMALLERARPGDILVGFGAGDIWRFTRAIPGLLGNS